MVKGCLLALDFVELSFVGEANGDERPPKIGGRDRAGESRRG